MYPCVERRWAAERDSMHQGADWKRQLVSQARTHAYKCRPREPQSCGKFVPMAAQTIVATCQVTPVAIFATAMHGECLQPMPMRKVIPGSRLQ